MRWDGPRVLGEGAFEGRDGELNEGIRVESGGVCQTPEMDSEVQGTLQAGDLLEGWGEVKAKKKNVRVVKGSSR